MWFRVAVQATLHKLDLALDLVEFVVRLLVVDRSGQDQACTSVRYAPWCWSAQQELLTVKPRYDGVFDHGGVFLSRLLLGTPARVMQGVLSVLCVGVARLSQLRLRVEVQLLKHAKDDDAGTLAEERTDP